MRACDISSLISVQMPLAKAIIHIMDLRLDDKLSLDDLEMDSQGARMLEESLIWLTLVNRYELDIMNRWSDFDSKFEYGSHICTQVCS